MRFSLLIFNTLVWITTLTAQTITNENFVLSAPEEPKGVLVLFPGFGQQGAQTQLEFDITEQAHAAGYAILFMDFNRHLWLTDTEKEDLAKALDHAITKEGLPSDHIIIGGFSSGGNVALLIANTLLSDPSTIQPSGVFVVDPPIDLEGLYANYQKSIERDADPTLVGEARYITQLLDGQLGTGPEAKAAYRDASPFLASEGYFENIAALKSIPVRLYTEPDMEWWRETKGVTELADTNAWMLKSLHQRLQEEHGWNQITYIPTTGRGYRANGDRHPHSCSIVDPADLLEWAKAL